MLFVFDERFEMNERKITDCVSDAEKKIQIR